MEGEKLDNQEKNPWINLRDITKKLDSIYFICSFFGGKSLQSFSFDQCFDHTLLVFFRIWCGWNEYYLIQVTRNPTWNWPENLYHATLDHRRSQDSTITTTLLNTHKHKNCASHHSAFTRIILSRATKFLACIAAFSLDSFRWGLQRTLKKCWALIGKDSRCLVSVMRLNTPTPPYLRFLFILKFNNSCT